MSLAPAPSAYRVLVIDDDDGIQALMRVLLRRADFDVDCVPDGEAALRNLQKQRYDSIVLDLMLPKVNGFEVLREMKSRAPELLKRTIVVTAASNLTLKDFQDGALVRRVIRKPFDI